jgi:hypothetical protein
LGVSVTAFRAQGWVKVSYDGARWELCARRPTPGLSGFAIDMVSDYNAFLILIIISNSGRLSVLLNMPDS